MKKLKLFLILALFCTGFANAQTASIDTVTFSSLEQNNSIYISEWSFRIGDDTSWAAKDLDDSGWKVFEQGNKKTDIDFLVKNGFENKAWFRKRLYFDSINYTFPFALQIKQQGAMEVYIDGVKKDTYGKIDAKGNDKFENQEIPLFFTVQNPGLHTITIRFSESNLKQNDDAFVSAFTAELYTVYGSFSKMKSTLLSAAPLVLATGVFFLVLFIIHILMFLFYRKDKSNLYFAIFNLGMSSFWIAFYLFLVLTSIAVQENYLYIIVISGFVAFIALSTFVNSLFSKFGWRYRIIVFIGIFTLAVVFLFDDSEEINSSLLLLFFSSVFLEAIVIIIKAIIRKVPGAKILGTGILSFIFSIVAVLVYISLNNGINFSLDNRWSIISFLGIFILVVYSIPLSLSAYLAWKVSNTNKHLAAQILQVESLSNEKQTILENQNQLLETKVNERTTELQIEKKKSDDLLLNILPLEIAEELKQTGTSQAQNHDEVSVLFTDFVNFTQTSEQLGVDELLNELNINFTAFDNIMEKHGMEKIKTIGDAYLAVSGLPKANEHHAKNAVLAALEIIDFVEKRKTEVSYGLDIRIGINSGPLIAGIVGVKKFAYDIWGDTVNIAARMEQSGAPGKVNISENTYTLVKQDFSFEHRGKIEAKNKGEMDMYFVMNKEATIK